MTNPYGNDSLVDQVIGSAYQVVRYVAANMQSIIDVSDAIPQLELWMPDITAVLAAMPVISNVNTNLPVITGVNNNLTMLSSINSNMAALLNINSNMAALLAIPGVIQAQDFKNSVAVATTANITLSGLQTIDGYTVPVGARVLVKDQTAPAENGIYVTATGAWTRATDAVAGMLSTGSQVTVDRGTVGVGKQFRLATLGTITVGTTAQSWVEMSSASTVVGQEDDGTPVTALAPHEIQFDNQHFSLTPVAQGVAIALSTDILDAIAAGGGGGGSGETNTASNLGTGVGLYATKVGVDLRFKSLVAGTNISFDVTGDSITLNAAGGGSGGIDVSAADELGASDTITDVQTLAFDPDQFFYDGDASGLGIHLAPGALDAIGGVGGGAGSGASGHQIFKDKSGTNLRFKTLIAGTNITIVPDVDNNSLTINSSGGGGGLTIEGSDSAEAEVGPVAVSNLYFDSNVFAIDLFEAGSYDVLLRPVYSQGKRVYVQGVDDTSTPVAITTDEGIAFSPDFEVIEVGGVATISLVGGGGGGGGIADAPDAGYYVRTLGGWNLSTSWSTALYNMGTGTSLVSTDAIEDNKLKLRGLKAEDGLQLSVVGNDVVIGMTSPIPDNLGYAEFYGTDLYVGAGGIGQISAATAAMAVFTANTYFAIPVLINQAGGKLTGVKLNIDSATKPGSGNLVLSLMKHPGYQDGLPIIWSKTTAFTSIPAGDTTIAVSPNFDLDPGIYYLIIQTSVNAAAMKMTTLSNVSPKLASCDPQSRACQQFGWARGSVAGRGSHFLPMDTDNTLDPSTLVGELTCPFIELSVQYPL